MLLSERVRMSGVGPRWPVGVRNAIIEAMVMVLTRCGMLLSQRTRGPRTRSSTSRT